MPCWIIKFKYLQGYALAYLKLYILGHLTLLLILYI